jgi:hypothetical protein
VVSAGLAVGLSGAVPIAPPLRSEWEALRLTATDAAALQRELAELHQRYCDRPHPGGIVYVLGACLAPLTDTAMTRGLIQRRR